MVKTSTLAMPSRARALDAALHPTHSRQAVENILVAAWARRRTWSRNDSALFLNDRSPILLAHLRRRPGAWPQHSAKFGRWLQSERPDLFDRAHATLAAAPTDEIRDRLLPSELI